MMPKEVEADNEALRWLVGFLSKEKTRLIAQNAESKVAYAELERKAAELREQINGIGVQSREFTDRYAAVEQQNTKLANLCVSMYRLHSSLDLREVITAVEEIVVNLIGCEELALFKVDETAGAVTLMDSCGIDAAPLQNIHFGAGRIGRAAAAGRLLIVRKDSARGSRDADDRLSAFIPLKVLGRVWGAIALFTLLPQRGPIGPADVELFDVLSTQAGLALYCAMLHGQRSEAPA